MARTFARWFLTPGDTFTNAAACYLKVDGSVAPNTAATNGWKLLQDPVVQRALEEQLKAIDKHADLDEQWVYDKWRAMANANIFDYVQIEADGKVSFKNLNPDSLTIAQQQAIREIKVDAKTGRITNIKLVNIDQAVANVARARGVLDTKREAGTKDRAAKLTERMNRAAKMLQHRMPEPQA